MGKATRWLKGLFGIKVKDKEEPRSQQSNGVRGRGIPSSDHLRRLRLDASGLCHNPATIPPNITAAEAAWLRSFYDEESEQSKHAIAVAAATAAAADAAVAAAQAAVRVVLLTSQGRGEAASGVGRGSCGEKWAAVKIQTVFRGFLARKALRALKGLVKIQALVRGFLVRKQAAAKFQSMQALIRAQPSARAQRTRRVDPQFEARLSLEKYEDARAEHLIASQHSRRLSSSFEAVAMEESPKIVEVDTGSRPKSRSRRTYSWMPDSGEDSFGKAASSPIHPCRIPARVATSESRNSWDHEWGLTGDECHFSTAQSTPRFACGCDTPAKSACVEGYLMRGYGEHPNYMAKTQSFKAKLRSQSAPKQRRLSLHEAMESRSSLSGVRMQRSCSQALNFRNAVLGKLGRSCDHFERETDFYPN